MIYVALCVSEAAILLALLCLYRAASYVDIFSFLQSRPGALFLCSIFILTVSIIWSVQAIRSKELDKRKLAMDCAANFLMLTLTAGSAEVGIRLLSVQSMQVLTGESFLGLALYPRKWTEVVAHYKAVLERTTRGHPFLIYDRILGWTVAPSHHSATGQDLSSAEGLRAPRIGMTFTDRQTRHSGLSTKPASVRIALIGDSMTYGNEVRCEESWGHALEVQLGPEVQVLNFGVSGYGLNQVLLRYERDVRPWKPQFVIVGVNSQEIKRMLTIYKFLNSPNWSGFPYSRPRLVIKNGIPLHINQPILPPTEIISYSSIKDIPSIALDIMYHPLEWERDGLWYFLQKSYFFRFLSSTRPFRPSVESARQGLFDKEMIDLSQYVLSALVRQVREDGSIPLVVHLPYQFELRKAAEIGNNYIPLSVQMLRNAGIDPFDTTGCLLEAKATNEYMPGGHYSPKANALIAKCLEPILRRELSRLNH
jgi:hypothetical protein